MTKLLNLLALALVAGLVAPAAADDKKEDGKKADKFEPKMLVGTWKVTGGKKAGGELSDMAKDGEYVITDKTITIRGGGNDLFVIKYTVDPKASPAAIDMEITKSPGDSANGAKALGIAAVTDDELKICYPPMGGDRPAKFDGDKFYYFTLKKQAKGEKKDK